MTNFSELWNLAVLPDLITGNLSLWVAGAIVVIGLFVLGWRDVIRFSPKRVWAISGVSFSESIRRRILWITPLAILGIILVSQLQRPIDPQDAIRQTTKISLFATGMLVAMTAIILACTNLPKEIENRVIYTVVTKPTTRLEIVAGKVLGFARVSAAILLIMGLFTWGYLHVRAWSMQRDVAERLEAGAVAPGARPTFEHYASAGLLNAKTFAEPRGFEVLSRLPDPDEPQRWMFGDSQQDFLVPVDVTPEALIPPAPAVTRQTLRQGLLQAGLREQVAGHESERLAQLFMQRSLDAQQVQVQLQQLMNQAGVPLQQAQQEAQRMVQQIQQPPVPGEAGLVILARIDYQRLSPQEKEAPAEAPLMPPFLPGTPQDAAAPPQIIINILDENLTALVPSHQINGGQPITLSPEGARQQVQAFINAPQAGSLALTPALTPDQPPRIIVQVIGITPGYEYGVGQMPVELYVPGADDTIKPSPLADGERARAMIRGRWGRHGQQLRGGETGRIPVAVYRYRGADSARAQDGQVPFEMRVGIERSGEELTIDDDDISNVSLIFHNQTTGQTSDPIYVHPESNRTAYFHVPAEAVQGGDFDVIVRCHTSGHWLGLQNRTLRMVTANQSFAYNLAKSLAILWLMAVLVVIVGIFSSTFLSWPIAVVLTIVILLGHWGVQQLGDAVGPGIGHQVATDLGFTDPARARVVSESVEALSRFLNFTASIMPDISRFAATEDIERGVSIPHDKLGSALWVVLGFGLPMMVLSYVFLKNKEVAP